MPFFNIAQEGWQKIPKSYWTVGTVRSLCAVWSRAHFRQNITLEFMWHRPDFWKVAGGGHLRTILDDTDTFEGIFPLHNELLFPRIASLTPRD